MPNLYQEPLDPALLQDASRAVLLDYQAPGAPLVIAFAAYNPEVAVPPYEFFGRLRKIESLSGQPLNKLLLRDPGNNWYHYGIPGLGSNAVSAAASLRGIVDQLRPSHTITLGQSMGSWAAILYGALINVDQVLAFGARAFFDSRLLHLCMDKRWSEVVQRVESAPPPRFFQHLPALLNSLDIKTCVKHFYGTKPSEEKVPQEHMVEAVNFDAVHGILLAQSRQVVPYPIRWSTHRVPIFLRQAGVIDELLLYHIFGEPYKYEPTDELGISKGWQDWFSSSYKLGFDEAHLLEKVPEDKNHDKEAFQHAFAVLKRNLIRQLLQ